MKLLLLLSVCQLGLSALTKVGTDQIICNSENRRLATYGSTKKFVSGCNGVVKGIIVMDQAAMATNGGY